MRLPSAFSGVASWPCQVRNGRGLPSKERVTQVIAFMGPLGLEAPGSARAPRDADRQPVGRGVSADAGPEGGDAADEALECIDVREAKGDVDRAFEDVEARFLVRDVRDLDGGVLDLG